MSGLEPKVPPREAARAVIESVGRVIPWLVGVPTLMYVVGWQISSGFYNTLGAPWAVGLLSTWQLMIAAKQYTLVFLIGAFVTMSVLQQGGSLEQLRRMKRITLLIGAVLIVAMVITSFVSRLKPWSDSISPWWFLIICLTLGAGVSDVALLVVREGRRWTAAIADETGYILLMGILMLPYVIGSNMATRFPDRGNVLPSRPAPYLTVALRSDESHMPWYLIGPVGDRLLIARVTSDKVDPNEPRKSREFRLVESTSELQIPGDDDLSIF